MLKKMASKKIMVALASLFALFLIYLVPKESVEKLNEIPKTLDYVSKEYYKGIAYLMTDKGYLARAEVVSNVSDQNIERKAKELLEILILGGSGESKVPSGFQAVLPSDTKILSIQYENGLLKVNLSEEVLDVKEEWEEKVIEAIVYTLTTIPEVKNIILYKEGDILDRLPKSGKILPSTLDRSFGINKKYDLSSMKEISKVTIYYVDKYNEDYYYVPVTKYLNDGREKIRIIVDELTSSSSIDTNLMSFLNSNAKLLAVEQVENGLNLEFNSYIFSDFDEKNILKEVIYTISLSVYDNYDVEEVLFEVDGEEITKSTLKNLE